MTLFQLNRWQAGRLKSILRDSQGKGLSLISVADISRDEVMRNEGRKANDHAGGINMREENSSKENDMEWKDHTGSVEMSEEKGK
jgi:hypothetical protein